MKEEIDAKDLEEEEADNEEYRKIEKVNFLCRLAPYSKPNINVILGLIISAVNGCVWPAFGALMTKCIFSLMNPDKDAMKDEAWDWCLYMTITSIISFIAIFVVRFSFGVVGENITSSIRYSMYKAVLKKPIGWFD
mmetsp:Transcript_43681/g.42198  ORF Transcript_43681/g.42198 Transcript_43681/m.42198 type:complete len:136 (+) Transcript_43681:586-993(+)